MVDERRGPVSVNLLVAVLDRVSLAREEGGRPVVVFDLDSTLFHTGERQRRIFVEFATQQGSPELFEFARGLSASDFGWSVLGPLRRAGWEDEALHRALMRFWSRRFFHDRFADVDLPERGAVAFVRAVADAGALCVYLTGRDAPQMGEGTLRLLFRAGFPIVDGRGLLWMKPSSGAGDADHKQSASRELGRLGTVVATFENEPGHANAFLRAFPDAVHVLLGDVHNPEAPVPDATLVRVPDFRGPWEG